MKRRKPNPTPVGLELPDDAEECGRRGATRTTLHGSVLMLHPARATGVIVDASNSGMRVHVDKRLDEGDRCIAQLRLPSGEETHARAHVVWSERDGKGWLVGLAFAELPEPPPSSSRAAPTSSP